MAQVVVIGAGIFGASAAIELRRRGADVALLDAGPIPPPLAESTDISKAIRLDYGADETYTAWMERALEGWRRFNEILPSPLFHETGVTFLSRGEMRPGGFEHESHAVLTRRGHSIEVLDAESIARRFPAWNAKVFTSGYFNPLGGWAESGRVVSALVDRARAEGAVVGENARAVRILERAHRVVGVALADGSEIDADAVIVTAGGWVGELVPEIASCLRTVGQPVFHLAPVRPERFEAERFPVFGADIARTGFYGFPLHPAAGVVKVANHGPGREMPSGSPARVVTEDEERAMRDFFRDAIPELGEAPIAGSRVCVYCDTRDEHFWIAPSPACEGLVVATGGSGHGFKFAPLLGEWIADALDGKVEPRFRWRPEIGVSHEEAARHREI